jgi:hypothetical protein
MAPLPPAVDVFNEPSELHIKSVYSLILQAEAATDDELKLICVRIVGYLLLYPINDTARERVHQQIKLCSRKHSPFEKNEALYSLGELYMNHFIRPRKLDVTSPFVSTLMQAQFIGGGPICAWIYHQGCSHWSKQWSCSVPCRNTGD